MASAEEDSKLGQQRDERGQGPNDPVPRPVDFVLRARWYYSSGGNRVGPISEQELRDRWNTGNLAPWDLVWRPGFETWIEASAVRGLGIDPGDESEPPSLPDAWLSLHDAGIEITKTKDEISTASADFGAAHSLEAPQTKPLPAGTLLDQRPTNGDEAVTPSGTTPSGSATEAPAVLSGQSVATFSAVCLGAYLFPWTEGAYRPSAFASWILAGISVWVFSVTLQKGFRRSSETCVRGYGKFIFTAVAGVLLLLLFQNIVLASVNGKDSSNFGPVWYMLLRGIGKGYQSALQPSGSFFGTLFATFFSVALCEEFIKALPVLRLVLSKNVNLMSRSDVNRMRADLPFLGAMSGLGFGIAEGMWYASEVYSKGDAPFGIYLVRFFGCAPLHAAWGGLTALAIANELPQLRSAFDRRSEAAKEGEAGWQHLILTYVMLQVPAMVLHSLYNAFLAKGWWTMGTLTVAVSLLILWTMSSTYMAEIQQAAGGRQRAGPTTDENRLATSPVSSDERPAVTSDS